MSRTVARVWHASLSAVAALLYFLFVIPRWWELTDFTPHTLGTVVRVVTGALIGLAALPAVFTLQRIRKPEYGTPQLALTLLTGAVVAHVTAGALIVVAALSEIWLSLDAAGQWLFGIYGAAAAIALLGIGAFYLSAVAELPPPPPKPLKPKKEKRRKKDSDAEIDGDVDSEDDDEAVDESELEAPNDDDEDEDDAVTDDAETAVDETESDAEPDDDTAAAETAPAPAGGRHKLRPSGKRRIDKNS
ncbi:hypothetical protein KIH27_17565 [Mycobacterium sp. M1]|uniref:Transmembrane protein n=1 Tax=Mycolicibacter acidiphilus TaxID=2835306 RepID=A0ABS5RM57_9MYCO|nr:hypothetical protein [Mycolicibacter acidiphilus]MBS9535397.1 hypothetical protein [Mycolicibacter acidiphilus]